MTQQEAIEILIDMANTLQLSPKTRHGKAFETAIHSLEAWEKVINELLHIDKPTDFGGYEDGVYEGVTLAIRTINKHLSK